MPELVEVEYYRRLAEAVLGRQVDAVTAPDAWYLKRGLTPELLQAAVTGRRLTAARRRGKLLLLDTEGGPTLGLRFGMTGRLVVDGLSGVEELIYSSNRREPAWDRLTLAFRDGGELRVSDPRRLGGVELDPAEDSLGPDAATVTATQLRRTLGSSSAPLKARLLDQSHLAGVGNLLADEILWQAGLSPLREAGSLSAEESARLARVIRSTVARLAGRGGSHTGDLMAHRRPGGICPRDGAALVRARAGGRTTWWCPEHQI